MVDSVHKMADAEIQDCRIEVCANLKLVKLVFILPSVLAQVTVTVAALGVLMLS